MAGENSRPMKEQSNECSRKSELQVTRGIFLRAQLGTQGITVLFNGWLALESEGGDSNATGSHYQTVKTPPPRLAATWKPRPRVADCARFENLALEQTTWFNVTSGIRPTAKSLDRRFCRNPPS
jgi:hypothetical protein